MVWIKVSQRKVLGNGRNVHLLCFDFMHWMSVAIWQVRFLELPFSINLWWFMAAYLSIYLLSPGINHFIDTCDKWQVLLAVLTITYISFGDYFVKSANIGGLFQMFSMYLSARWIKLYLKKWIDNGGFYF